VDNSLVRFQADGDAGGGEARLAMLETVREYGLERLAEHGEDDTARGRHAAYYLALAEAAEAELGGPNGPARLARLERDHDNLRAALGSLLQRRQGERALRLAAAVWRFWSTRGHLSEGRRWLREALAATAEAAPSVAAARAKALAGAALLALEQGAYDEAADDCARAIELAREHGVHGAFVVALNTWGRLEREQGRYAEAMRHHEEARRVARGLGDRGGEAAALVGLAFAATFASDVARGTSLAEQGLALFHELGDPHGLAEALVGAATAAAHGGAFASAEALAAEALSVLRDLGDSGRVAVAAWPSRCGCSASRRCSRASPDAPRLGTRTASTCGGDAATNTTPYGR
jgi:tetratricopeptide (TPR) repeat protein